MVPPPLAEFFPADVSFEGALLPHAAAVPAMATSTDASTTLRTTLYTRTPLGLPGTSLPSCQMVIRWSELYVEPFAAVKRPPWKSSGTYGCAAAPTGHPSVGGRTGIQY